MEIKPLFSYTHLSNSQIQKEKSPVSTNTNPSTTDTAEVTSRIPPAQEEKSTLDIQVSLSEEGLYKSAEADKNKDIDESNLPEVIKDLLKRIRELKEQLQELSQKMQEVAYNSELTDEEKEMQLKIIQAEISSVDKALRDAMNHLNQTMRDLELSKDAKTEVSNLLLA